MFFRKTLLDQCKQLTIKILIMEGKRILFLKIQNGGYSKFLDS